MFQKIISFECNFRRFLPLSNQLLDALQMHANKLINPCITVLSYRRELHYFRSSDNFLYSTSLIISLRSLADFHAGNVLPCKGKDREGHTEGHSIYNRMREKREEDRPFAANALERSILCGHSANSGPKCRRMEDERPTPFCWPDKIH